MPNYYPLFVLAVSLLILTPGPNVALIVANSVAHGARTGLLTVGGTSFAILVHMILIGGGMAGTLGSAGRAFEWLRWAGVLYLLYLGLQTWRAPATDLTQTRPQPLATRAVLLRAMLVSATNPKVLLFYGAFFPQFIAPDRPLGPQLWVLCSTYLVLAIGIDCLWVLAASRARLVIGRYGRLRNRISGGLLMGAGLGLALTRPR